MEAFFTGQSLSGLYFEQNVLGEVITTEDLATKSKKGAEKAYRALCKGIFL